MAVFRVSPRYNFKRSGWSGARQLPSFEISNCATAEQAEKVALDILSNAVYEWRGPVTLSKSIAGGQTRTVKVGLDTHRWHVMAVDITPPPSPPPFPPDDDACYDSQDSLSMFQRGDDPS